MGIENKVYFKCGHLKPIGDFYKHPRMGDGRLNKCKLCTKNDVKSRYEIKIEDPEFVKKERARGRNKYARLGYIRRKTAHKENKNTAQKLKIKGYNLENCEVHHWNYYLKNDVFILNRRAHKLVHKYLTFDKESKCFFDNRTNSLLDSKYKHHQFVVEIFNYHNVDYTVDNVPDF